MEIILISTAYTFSFVKIQRVLRQVKYKQAARSAYICIRCKYYAGKLVCFRGTYMSCFIMIFLWRSKLKNIICFKYKLKILQLL